jgi:O-antigen ligase
MKSRIIYTKGKSSFSSQLLYSFFVLTLFSSMAIPNNVALNSYLTSISGLIPFSVVNEFTYMTRYSLTTLIVRVYVVIFSLFIVANISRIKLRSGMSTLFGVLLGLFFIYRGVSALFWGDFAFLISYILFVELLIVMSLIQKRDLFSLKTRVIRIIEVAGMINASAILVQYAVMSNFDFFNLAKWRIYRPSGISYDAILSTLLAGFAIAAILHTSRNRDLTLSSIAKIAFISIAGIYTGSRTIFMVILVCVVGYFLFSNIPSKTKIRSISVGIILCAILSIAFGDFLQSFLDLVQDTGFMSNPRELKLDLATRLFLDNPIVGVGTNRYEFYEGMLLSSYAGIGGTNPHNIYYQVLAENGLLGFLLASIGASGIWLIQLKKRECFPFGVTTLYLAVGYTLGVLGSAQFTALTIVIGGLFVKKET